MYINTLASRRSLRFTREGEDGGGGGDPTDLQQQVQPPKESKFTAPKDQDEFDRMVRERIDRVKSQYADYDSLKEKAQAWDEVEASTKTDLQRDLDEAREEAFHEAMGTIVPKLVRQAFKAEAKGVLSDEQLDTLLEDLDLVQYATDDGDPDEKKIKNKITKIAGTKGSNGRGPGFGQGSGHGQSKGKPGEGGLIEAQKRFGQKSSA